MSRLLLNIFLVFIGLSIGMFIERVPYLTLDKNVNVVAAMNLLFMAGLAILIPSLLTRKIDNHRCKKNLLISEIELLNSISKEVQVIIESSAGNVFSTADIKNIKYLCKKLKGQFSLLKSQTDNLGNDNVNKQVLEMEKDINNYWEVVTGDACPLTSPVTPAFIWNQDRQFNRLSKGMSLLKFMINDS